MSSSGATGFGIGGMLPPVEVSPEQIAIATGDHTALLKSMEESLKRLAEKFVEQPLEQPNLFTIKGSATVFGTKLDYSAQPHNSIIVCVISGTLNLWLGDYSGLPQTAAPNCGQFGIGPPLQLFFPLRGRVYTVVNPSTTVDLVASLVPVAI